MPVFNFGRMVWGGCLATFPLCVDTLSGPSPPPPSLNRLGPDRLGVMYSNKGQENQSRSSESCHRTCFLQHYNCFGYSCFLVHCTLWKQKKQQQIARFVTIRGGGHVKKGTKANTNYKWRQNSCSVITQITLGHFSCCSWVWGNLNSAKNTYWFHFSGKSVSTSELSKKPAATQEVCLWLPWTQSWFQLQCDGMGVAHFPPSGCPAPPRHRWSRQRVWVMYSNERQENPVSAWDMFSSALCLFFLGWMTCFLMWGCTKKQVSCNGREQKKYKTLPRSRNRRSTRNEEKLVGNRRIPQKQKPCMSVFWDYSDHTSF